LEEGIGQIMIANLLVGLMYLLLSMCLAELTSTVTFVGGSFGYCRCSLGPFWGYLVGASEAFENFLVTIALVFNVSTACTAGFGTDRAYEPLWMAITYLIMCGIHLRGGALLWHSIMGTGAITVILILIYCGGTMEHINMEKYAYGQGLFKRSPFHFMQGMFYSAWFYIGVEIVPQTCKRIINVNVNLPRGLVVATLFTFVISFWVMIGACGNFPGASISLALDPFPLTFGYKLILRAPRGFGAIMAILPSFAAALVFMYGCGYQLQALSNSGILPTIFAKSFGENETPYFNLVASSLIQYLVCILIWFVFPYEIPVLLQVVFVGAALVYTGLFAAFIVFRTHFGNMKRHWVSPLGIPGAVLGIGIAQTMFVSVTFFQATYEPIVFYCIYLFAALIFYFAYAKKYQFFSPEEQKKFLKVYILNANKRNRKKKPLYLQKIESFFLPVTAFVATITGDTTMQSRSNLDGPKKGATSLTNAGNKSLSKFNAISPVDSQGADARVAATPSAPTVASPSTSTLSVKNSTVSPAPEFPTTATAEKESNGDIETRGAETTNAAATHHQHHSKPNGGLRASQQLLRSSLAISGSMRMTWSGKVMNTNESRKFFEVLASEEDHPIEKLIVALPDQFVLDDTAVNYDVDDDSAVAFDVDGNILLNEMENVPSRDTTEFDATPRDVESA
jgi:ethanolamine permease